MTSVARVCSVEGCGGKHYAKEYCNLHYQRHNLGIKLDAPTRKIDPGRGCKVEMCNRPHGQNGYCPAHNKRWLAGKHLDTPIRRRRFDLPCQVSNCLGVHHSRGMCSKHDRVCRSFNLSVVQYQIIQDGGCAICGLEGLLHIDHDHSCCPENGRSCGKCIRGGLCPNCNVGLGMFSDSVESLANAISYLSSKV